MDLAPSLAPSVVTCFSLLHAHANTRAHTNMRSYYKHVCVCVDIPACRRPPALRHPCLPWSSACLRVSFCHTSWSWHVSPERASCVNIHLRVTRDPKACSWYIHISARFHFPACLRACAFTPTCPWRNSKYTRSHMRVHSPRAAQFLH